MLRTLSQILFPLRALSAGARSRLGSPRRSCRPCLEALEDRRLLAGMLFSVTNTSDSGPGSLRDAIAAANAEFLRAGLFQSLNFPDLIDFEIPAAPGTVPSIHLLSPLPFVTDVVWIWGESEDLFQGGAGDRPSVELDGSAAGPFAAGLVLTQPSTFVTGLVINRFSGDGLLVNNGSDFDLIANNRIGTDFTGFNPLPNGGNGISYFGSSGVIGAIANGIIPPVPFPANVISFNGGDGIFMNGSFNQVGPNSIVGNGGNGVELGGGDHNVIGGALPGGVVGLGNTIALNGNDGVLATAGIGNVISGNSITLNGNGGRGIELQNDANLRQTAPSHVILRSVFADGPNGLLIDCDVHGEPGLYTVEFFLNNPAAADQTEGDLYLGSARAQIGDNGDGVILITHVDPPIPGPYGYAFFTATVTDQDGNTSEFSPPQPYGFSPSPPSRVLHAARPGAGQTVNSLDSGSFLTQPPSLLGVQRNRPCAQPSLVASAAIVNDSLADVDDPRVVHDEGGSMPVAMGATLAVDRIEAFFSILDQTKGDDKVDDAHAAIMPRVLWSWAGNSRSLAYLDHDGSLQC
jgi:hypothetical protein